METAGLHLHRSPGLADLRASLQDLEQRVQQRTMDLAEANQRLLHEMVERRRAERLRSVAVQIARLALSDIDEAEFCRQIHAAVYRLVDARIFCIGLLSDKKPPLELIHFISDVEHGEQAHALVSRLSEYVMRHGKVLLHRAQILDLIRVGAITPKVEDSQVAVSLIGVALTDGDETIGLIVVQSYDEPVIYEFADLELLSFVALQVSSGLHRRRSAEALRRANAELEQSKRERLQELHARNAELEIAHAKLKVAQEQAAQSEKLASIGQLAAGVAHEINNPMGYVNSNLGSLQSYVSQLLNAVEAYATAIRRHGDAATIAEAEAIRQRIDLDYLSADIPKLISESREGVDRVCKIIRDLKDFSRHDRGEAWVRTDVHQLLESTLNIVSNQLKYKAQIVKTFADVPLIECLPSELNQVFLNILMNAGQAIQAHGIITVSTGSAGDKIWIAIGDDGDGIPADVLPRIFDPFFTTKPVGTGTGLGLSISYGIVVKHHGNIEVTSVPGQGTLLRIELPITQPKSDTEGQP